jgi:hypothetical protein
MEGPCYFVDKVTMGVAGVLPPNKTLTIHNQTITVLIDF